MPVEVLTMWTVYDHLRDYPDKWVLRAWDMPGGRRETVETADTLEEIRAKIRRRCSGRRAIQATIRQSMRRGADRGWRPAGLRTP